MSIKQYLIKKDLVVHDTAWDENQNEWLLVISLGTGRQQSIFLRDIPREYWGKVGFCGETLTVRSELLFIPKSIPDLKREGWKEGEKEKLVRKAFFMGKKKRSLLQKPLVGTLGFDKGGKPAVVYDRFSFREDQVKYAISYNRNNWDESGERLASMQKFYKEILE